MLRSGMAEVSVGNIHADHATIRSRPRDFRGQATRATSDIKNIAIAADARKFQEHRREHGGPTAEKNLIGRAVAGVVGRTRWDRHSRAGKRAAAQSIPIMTSEALITA